MSAGGPIVTVTLNPAIDQTLTIPGFAAGQVNRVAQSDSHPGGKGVNVAVVLADLGAAVAATGLLGDRNAEGFERLFREKGIADHFVRIPGETRVGIKIVDPTGGVIRSLVVAVYALMRRGGMGEGTGRAGMAERAFVAASAPARDRARPARGECCAAPAPPAPGPAGPAPRWH